MPGLDRSPRKTIQIVDSPRSNTVTASAPSPTHAQTHTEFTISGKRELPVPRNAPAHPDQTVVACQTGRSQHANRDTAMKMLAAKLYELEVQKRNAEKDALEATKSDIGWGSQIRNYVLDQSRIKDLRTGIERTDTQKVLDGDLDEFIEASLKSGLEAGSRRTDAM